MAGFFGVLGRMRDRGAFFEAAPGGGRGREVIWGKGRKIKRGGGGGKSRRMDG